LELQPKNKKILLLCIFYLAFFLDTFNNSSLFTAIPLISAQLNISDSQSVWLLGAYQLTFAALLLIMSSIYTWHSIFHFFQSGRVSDLYNPKWVFVTGAWSTVGVFALINGFIRTEIPPITVRALTGAGFS
ncbi:hypothetical protein B0H14DRAFT_2277173, partial [Mycena olivaceomarginata]